MHKTINTNLYNTSPWPRGECMLCASAILFLQTSRGRSVWCGTVETPTYCVFGLLPWCVCVNMCVQVETQASKHRLFRHGCTEQQFWRREYVCVCVCVCARMSVLHKVFSLRLEARQRLRKTRGTVKRVSRQTAVWLTSLPSTRRVVRLFPCADPLRHFTSSLKTSAFQPVKSHSTFFCIKKTAPTQNMFSKISLFGLIMTI